jgi:hypothetical protein
VMGVVFSWGLFQFCSWSVLLYVVVVAVETTNYC